MAVVGALLFFLLALLVAKLLRHALQFSHFALFLGCAFLRFGVTLFIGLDSASRAPFSAATKRADASLSLYLSLESLAMARKPWVPLLHEKDLFCNVYIDESSQTKHRYLLLGGLVVPLSHADLFEADIIAARDPVIAPFRADGIPRVIKWEKVNAYNLAAYKKVFDAFWSFELRHQLYGPKDKHVDLHCVVVDTSKKSLRATGEGDIETGFNKEIYFLSVALIGKRFDKELFHIYLDRRTTSHSLNDARKIMNFGARKYGDTRPWPFRRLSFHDPEKCQALQVVDILIGALAYKINGHYDKPEANKARKELCDYILLKKAKISKPLQSTHYSKRRFTIIHRDGSKYVKQWR